MGTPDEDEEDAPYTGPKIYVEESYPEQEEALPFNPKDSVRIRANESFDQYYELYGEPIGEGKFGKVYLCRERTTGLEFAAKFIRVRKDADRISVEREVSIMTQMRHPRIAQIYDAFYTLTNDVILVMEIVKGGELFNRIVEEQYVLTERAITMIICQICEALDYIHSQNIVHLDIKPENIMCVSEKGNRIKLIDFGLARHYDGRQALYDMVGTPEFAAPEVVLYEQLDYHTDMWSIGVITYLLISGLSPFQGETTAHTYLNVQRGDWDFTEEFESVSDDAKDFISKLLIKKKEDRMLPRECLQHPWIVKSRAKKANDTLLSLANTGPALDTDKLRAYVTRRRFRKAIFAVMVFTGFRDILATLRKNNSKEGETFFSNIIAMSKEENKDKPTLKNVLAKKNKRKESGDVAPRRKAIVPAKLDPVPSTSDIENIPLVVLEPPKSPEPRLQSVNEEKAPPPPPTPVDEAIVKKKRVAVRTRKLNEDGTPVKRKVKKLPQRDVEMQDTLSPSTAIILGNMSSSSPDNSDREGILKKKVVKSASDVETAPSASDASDKETTVKVPKRRQTGGTPPRDSVVGRLTRKLDSASSSDTDRKVVAGKPPMKPRANTVSLVQARLQKLSGDLNPPSFINNVVVAKRPSEEKMKIDQSILHPLTNKAKSTEMLVPKGDEPKKEGKLIPIVTEKKTTTTLKTTTSTKSEQKSSEKTVLHSASGKSIEVIEKKTTTLDRTKVTSLRTKKEENGDVTNVDVKKNTAKADTTKTLTEKNRKEESDSEGGRVLAKSKVMLDHQLHKLSLREEATLNGEKKSDVTLTTSHGSTKKAEGRAFLDKKSEELKGGDVSFIEIGKSKVEVSRNGKVEATEKVTRTEAKLVQDEEKKPKLRVKKTSTEKTTSYMSSAESADESDGRKKSSVKKSKPSDDESSDGRKKSVRFSTVVEEKEVPARVGFGLMKMKSESSLPVEITAREPPKDPPKKMCAPVELPEPDSAFDFSLLRSQLERRVSNGFATDSLKTSREPLRVPLDGPRKAMNMWKRMEQGK